MKRTILYLVAASFLLMGNAKQASACCYIPWLDPFAWLGFYGCGYNPWMGGCGNQCGYGGYGGGYGHHGGKFKHGKHGHGKFKHGKHGKHGMFGGGGKFKKWK